MKTTSPKLRNHNESDPTISECITDLLFSSNLRSQWKIPIFPRCHWNFAFFGLMLQCYVTSEYLVEAVSSKSCVWDLLVHVLSITSWHWAPNFVYKCSIIGDSSCKRIDKHHDFTSLFIVCFVHGNEPISTEIWNALKSIHLRFQLSLVLLPSPSFQANHASIPSLHNFGFETCSHFSLMFAGCFQKQPHPWSHHVDPTTKVLRKEAAR